MFFPVQPTLPKDLLADLRVLYRVPYTVTKFVAFEKVSETILGQFDKSTLSSGAMTGINLGSGLLAGLAAAIVSQPADTMLSKINKTKGLPGESTISRLAKIARELGVRGSFAGLPTRLFMVGGLTAGQFAIYGDIKKALGMFMTVSRVAYARSNITLLTSSSQVLRMV